MPKTDDRVKETTTTTGVGDITLSGASSGFQSFSTAFNFGDVVMYCIVGQSSTEWEVGRGTLINATTLSRTVVEESSTGSAVNFSAGTKDVFATVTGEHLGRSNIGRVLMYRGCTWPQYF